MTRDEVIEFYDRHFQPFRPFDIVLSNGDVIPIRIELTVAIGKDFLAASPDRRRVRRVPLAEIVRMESCGHERVVA